jgi:hypothetical protein
VGRIKNLKLSTLHQAWARLKKAEISDKKISVFEI